MAILHRVLYSADQMLIYDVFENQPFRKALLNFNQQFNAGSYEV